MPRSTKRPSTVDIAVGRNVRIWRMARGLSQTQLAQRLGITFQQIQKYEVGANRIGAGRLVKIAATLGVPVTALLDSVAAAEDMSVLVSLVANRRSFRLADAFAAITDAKLRLSIVDLVEKLAGAAPQRKGRRR